MVIIIFSISCYRMKFDKLSLDLLALYLRSLTQTVHLCLNSLDLLVIWVDCLADRIDLILLLLNTIIEQGNFLRQVFHLVLHLKAFWLAFKRVLWNFNQLLNFLVFFFELTQSLLSLLFLLIQYLVCLFHSTWEGIELVLDPTLDLRYRVLNLLSPSREGRDWS